MESKEFGELILNARNQLNLSQDEVSRCIGVSQVAYGMYELGKRKPKLDRALKLVEVLKLNKAEVLKGLGFDDVDAPSGDYIFNARPIGDPVGTHQRGRNVMEQLSSGLFRLKTKLVTQKAQAGYITGWGDDEFIEDLPEHDIIINKPVAGEYISFEVGGDSMDDGSKESIESGSVATGRKIDRRYWRNKLHLKKYQDFIIVCNNTVTNEGGIIVKRILEHNTDENYIICHSLNPDKKCYPDFRLNMIDIMQLFNVVQVTRKY